MTKQSRPLRIDDKEYKQYAKLASEIGISVADTLRLQLREGAVILRKKLGKNKP